MGWTAYDANGRVIETISGNVTVVQGTGSNLHTVVDSGTISTITNVVHVDDNAGSITVDGTVALAAGSAVIGHVITDSGSTTAVTGNVTVIQGTATSLKTQAENYQGGTAVGAANPLQVSLANTGTNATAVKVDGSAVTQPVSGSLTPGVYTTTGSFPGAALTINVLGMSGMTIATTAGAVDPADLIDVSYSIDGGVTFTTPSPIAPPTVGSTLLFLWLSQFGYTHIKIAQDVTTFGFTLRLTSFGPYTQDVYSQAIFTAVNLLGQSGGGGYVRQDSSATIAKETGGNLASAATRLLALNVAQGAAVSGVVGPLVQGRVDTESPSSDDNLVQPLSLDQGRRLRVISSAEESREWWTPTDPLIALVNSQSPFTSSPWSAFNA